MFPGNEKLLVKIDTFLTNKVREFFSLCKSTTRDGIYLSCLRGGIGVKQVSTVYYCTPIVFITKTLNHNEEVFKNIARESLKLDIKKRGINNSNAVNNFLGYEVNNDHYLVSKTNFASKTEWMELNRYYKTLNVKLQWVNNLATIIFNDKPCHSNNLNKALFEYTKSQLKVHAGSLSLQGAFLQIQNFDEKISNAVHYNWKLNDELLIFCVKARLNILPTNVTLYIWNRNNDPRCQFCNHCIESIARLLNWCHAEFGNFYSKRHNRIINDLFDQLKFIDRRYRNYNKNIETIMPEHRKVLELCNARKPGIVRYDPVTKSIEIVEITICYDSYFEQAVHGKYEKYRHCWVVRKIYKNREKAKNILKWCSTSIIIGANYIWRNRVKMLLVWYSNC